MFRTVFPSIIRSSRLYIQQQAFVKQTPRTACYSQQAVSGINGVQRSDGVPGAPICCTCFAFLSSFRCNYVVIVVLMALAASGHLAYNALCLVSLLFPWPVWPCQGGPTEHIFVCARTRSRRTCVGITTVYVTGGGTRRIPISVMDGLPQKQAYIMTTKGNNAYRIERSQF